MLISNYVNYSDLIKECCKPLFRFMPIKKFSYVEVEEGGEFIILCSDKCIYEEFIKAELFTNCAIETLSLYNTPGCYLNDYYNFHQDLATIQNKYINFYQKFDYGHAFFIIENEIVNGKTKYKIYVYETNLENQKINHDYINNIDALKRFNLHFHKEFEETVPSLQSCKMEQKVWSEFSSTINQCKIDVKNNQHKKNAFQLTINELLKNKLTRREFEILFWYLNGKTAWETGIILGISVRTVENIFERMKVKINCTSKTEVLIRYSYLIK